ncbi:hypothetical protein ACFFIO_11220 [Citricoccus parietis]|uniref:Antitoxin n=1 Tax=Citricoccus parietis TaxID=592307 RepID=A0ABV6F6D1_9MICC
MAGLGTFGKIVMAAASNPKVRGALQSPKAKQLGGKAVDGAANLAQKAAKGKHQDKIQRARDEALKRLGGRP